MITSIYSCADYVVQMVEVTVRPRSSPIVASRLQSTAHT
jgi:hypothetical protein